VLARKHRPKELAQWKNVESRVDVGQPPPAVSPWSHPIAASNTLICFREPLMLFVRPEHNSNVAKDQVTTPRKENVRRFDVSMDRADTVNPIYSRDDDFKSVQRPNRVAFESSGVIG